MSIEHYENFPVASVLCPPRIRPAVVAIYRFARTADDLADEGDQDRDHRLADLHAYRHDLRAMLATGARSARWPEVFEPLGQAVQRFQLPTPPLFDLLSAFEQDTANPRYATSDALLDYCRRSANPVGRLMLHLFDVHDARSLDQSDHICTALQLINFWQDLSVDLPRGRVYVPLADAQRHGLDLDAPEALRDTPASRRLVLELCDDAEAHMRRGAPLARRVRGRAGWELRGVVVGGLRILHKIRRLGGATISQRPTVGVGDALPLVLQAVFRYPAGAHA